MKKSLSIEMKKFQPPQKKHGNQLIYLAKKKPTAKLKKH